MRVLITTLPGYGHLALLLPLAAALRRCGHEVAFAASARCGAGLARFEIELIPCGPPWLEADFGRGPAHAPLADLRSYFEAEVVPGTLADVEAAARSYRPDLIVSNDFEFAGRVVAERLAIPFVLVSSGPRLSRDARIAKHAPIHHLARRLSGLREDNGLDYSLHWLHLCLSPPTWAFRPPNVPSAPHQPAGNEFGVRPRVADLGGASEAPSGSRPAALCTLGTVFNKQLDLLTAVVLGVAPRVSRLVVVGGPGVSESVLGPMPANVEYVAQASVAAWLPHVDYVVTHGGAGTLTAVQLAGKASLLLPQGGDQVTNAAACVQSGLSVALARFGFATSGLRAAGPLTPAVVGQAFDELSHDRGYRERAERFQSLLDALPPLEFAVELMAQLAATKQPVTI